VPNAPPASADADRPLRGLPYLVIPLPLVIGLVGWASGQSWLLWPAIPVAVLLAISLPYWGTAEARADLRDVVAERLAERRAFQTATDGRLRDSSRRATSASIRDATARSTSESTTFACVGLAVFDKAELTNLVLGVKPLATPLGEAGRVKVSRWQDSSGARLVVEISGDGKHDLAPLLREGCVPICAVSRCSMTTWRWRLSWTSRVSR
jgi:hypothetical protein